MANKHRDVEHDSYPAAHPLADHIGYALRRAQLAVFQDFCESTAEMQLRPAEYAVLVILERYPTIRQNRLAGMLAIKPANCAIMINKLERRGVLRRVKLPLGGRAVALELTKSGQMLVRQATRKVDQHRRRLQDKLGPKGSTQLLRLLSKLFEDSGLGGDELLERAW